MLWPEGVRFCCILYQMSYWGNLSFPLQWRYSLDIFILVSHIIPHSPSEENWWPQSFSMWGAAWVTESSLTSPALPQNLGGTLNLFCDLIPLSLIPTKYATVRFSHKLKESYFHDLDLERKYLIFTSIMETSYKSGFIHWTMQGDVKENLVC